MTPCCFVSKEDVRRHRSIKLPPQALIKVSCVVDAPSGLSYFLYSCIAADKDELIFLKSYNIMHIQPPMVQYKYIIFVSFYMASWLLNF